MDKICKFEFLIEVCHEYTPHVHRASLFYSSPYFGKFVGIHASTIVANIPFQDHTVKTNKHENLAKLSTYGFILTGFNLSIATNKKNALGQSLWDCFEMNGAVNSEVWNCLRTITTIIYTWSHSTFSVWHCHFHRSTLHAMLWVCEYKLKFVFLRTSRCVHALVLFLEIQHKLPWCLQTLYNLTGNPYNFSE